MVNKNLLFGRQITLVLFVFFVFLGKRACVFVGTNINLNERRTDRPADLNATAT